MYVGPSLNTVPTLVLTHRKQGTDSEMLKTTIEAAQILLASGDVGHSCEEHRIRVRG